MAVITLNTTINAVCAHLRNFFVIPGQRITGQFELSGGKIRLPLDLKVGQRIYIEPTDEYTSAVGSYLIVAKTSNNDFLYALDGLDKVSDTWRGTIYGQNMPADFVQLCKSIAEWEAVNAPSNLVSESVSGFYSMTLSTGTDGLPAGAPEVFRKDLARFRGRMVTGVRY